MAAEQVSRAVGTHARVVEATDAGPSGSFAGSPSSGEGVAAGVGAGGATAGTGVAIGAGVGSAKGRARTRMTIAPR